MYARKQTLLLCVLCGTFHHDEKISPGWWGWCTPTRFLLFTIAYKVAVYAPVERPDTLPLFHLYPLCTLRSGKYTSFYSHFKRSLPDLILVQKQWQRRIVFSPALQHLFEQASTYILKCYRKMEVHIMYLTVLYGFEFFGPFPGPNPLPLALVMHASKTLCTGLYKT